MKLILACTESGGIGYQNTLPWNNLYGDLYRFKKLTQDSIVVMGRKTWESLPKKPLPNRLNMIVTSSNIQVPSGAITIKDLSSVENHPNCWLIGGAQLVNSSWDKITQVHLTVAHTQFYCDAFVDLSYLYNNFNCIHMQRMLDNDYQIWERKCSNTMN